jgi:hypothetical protein
MPALIPAIFLTVLNFVIFVLVLYVCFYLFEKFILPVIPQGWLKYLAAGLAAIAIIYLLVAFFGLHL